MDLMIPSINLQKGMQYMNRFQCDNSYLSYLDEYSGRIVKRVGVFSPSAEREVLCMADAGNTVACKLYGDLLFYKKILREAPYRDAFSQYMKAAGISVTEEGGWQCASSAFPLAFWSVGYYLVNYRCDSFLANCEEIPLIEKMTLPERLGTALELACACVEYIRASEAVNLIGRILSEAAGEEELFEALLPVIREYIADREFPKISLKTGKCGTLAECAACAEVFFKSAAQEGYVYACNNLAVREAGKAIALKNAQTEDTDEKEKALSDAVNNYIYYLKIAADKYEPYAANRLGLFYKTGEVRCPAGKVYFKSYINSALAKEYFLKATVYPDSNSAWAYYNLLKFYPLEYDQNLELMGEYMDTIKILNPKVYELVLDL